MTVCSGQEISNGNTQLFQSVVSMGYCEPGRKPEDLGLDVTFDYMYHTALRSVAQLPNAFYK